MSSGAIFPAEVVLETANKDLPSPTATSSDYNGTWKIGTTGALVLTLSGNPATPKAKGTFANSSFPNGAKFKGRIVGTELSGVIRGKATLGATTGRSKIELSVHLTDSTHFSGSIHAFIKKTDMGIGPISGTKV